MTLRKRIDRLEATVLIPNSTSYSLSVFQRIDALASYYAGDSPPPPWFIEPSPEHDAQIARFSQAFENAVQREGGRSDLTYVVGCGWLVGPG